MFIWTTFKETTTIGQARQPGQEISDYSAPCPSPLVLAGLLLRSGYPGRRSLFANLLFRSGLCGPPTRFHPYFRDTQERVFLHSDCCQKSVSLCCVFEVVRKMRSPLCRETAARQLGFSIRCDTQVRLRYCISENNFIQDSNLLDTKSLVDVDLGSARSNN